MARQPNWRNVLSRNDVLNTDPETLARSHRTVRQRQPDNGTDRGLNHSLRALYYTNVITGRNNPCYIYMGHPDDPQTMPRAAVYIAGLQAKGFYAAHNASDPTLLGYGIEIRIH